MTSYQKLKKRIAELEADRLRLLDDTSYYFEKVLGRQMYLDWQKMLWFGDHEPTGKLKEGFFESLLKHQEQDANDHQGKGQIPPKG